MDALLYFVRQMHDYAGKGLYVNMLAMAGIGLLEGVGILMLIPMIAMTGLVELDAAGTPVAGLFDTIGSIPPAVGLPAILGIYVLISIGQSVLQKLITVRNSKIQHGFFRHMRIQTYDSILHANWRFFIKHRKSDLINVLTSELARASAGTYSILQFLAGLVFTFIQIGLAFWLSPTITSFVLLFGLILLFFSRKFVKRAFALGSQNYELSKTYLAGITDQVNGIKDIKSNTLEESRMSWYRDLTDRIRNEQIDFTKVKTTSQLYYKTASAVLIAVFVYLAITLFSAQLAQLMLILVIFGRLWPRVAGIQASLEQISTMIPAFRAVKAMQHECRNAREFSDSDDAEPLNLQQGITCRNVMFRYNRDADKLALNDVNTFFPANRMTAVVGRSGAGKSTLIDLLMGLNQPETGEVLFDGKPLTSDTLVSLRKAISYVPQDPFLFNATIRENMMLMKPDATEEEIWEALEFSSAAEFVDKLEDGLDSLIGDRGIRLSGGERQRLVLARAILRQPSILVLDEATSALDTENEKKIQAAIDRLKGKMTIVVIAHRLSTIRNADQVIVLEDGKVIQNGEYTKLAGEKSGVFRSLLRNQMQAT
ncbi:ABC transporter ATP-binding protein [Alteribacter natronophilus]|uniref:ABC transporter ATP-binding protein n=1 Tax=Alteribacter natronophilus TaxID=2583810 RepID=UPI00110E30B3|nr:ABC transporter ATP-binding protein [Alteribacter natronophilus]TMW70528.1 ABC transporter ATP-binding protein [Alteribacter natronophilus]